MWWFPSKNICQKSSGSVFMNCWRSPPCWSLIFCKTYKFLCNMWCVMCDAWCVMFRTWFFVRSWLNELRGDQKHPIWVISDLFNDIPKSIPGGSHMYTTSCKASHVTIYTRVPTQSTGKELKCPAFIYLCVFGLRKVYPPSPPPPLPQWVEDNWTNSKRTYVRVKIEMPTVGQHPLGPAKINGVAPLIDPPRSNSTTLHNHP